MRVVSQGPRGVALIGALVCASLAPAGLQAQSELDASAAEAFMGRWHLPLQTDMGAFDIALVIEDEGGKVAATVGGADLGTQSVTDITLDGDQLVLDYEVDVQGQFFPVVLTLQRDGEGLTYVIDAAGGQYTLRGKGSRATS